MNAFRFWSREIPIRLIFTSVRAHPLRVVLALGVLFRLGEYLTDRIYWMDEVSIVGCIRDLGGSGVFGPLGSMQLAPPGFLASQWILLHLIGDFRLTFRLIPLVAGIVALFSFRDLAHRCLSLQAEWVAVGLFAVTDDLIYFTAEAKQYSSDLALTLVLLVVALRIDRGSQTLRQSVGLAALGTVLVWCSHPVIFTLAGVGLVGLTTALRYRNLQLAASWMGVGLAWMGSFALVHAVAMRQLGHRHDMWVFWDFAFPPLPPRSVWDLLWPVWRVMFLFASPLNFNEPLGPRWSIWPAVTLTLLGWVRLIRSSPDRVALITLPGSCAMVAAYLRLYPFHGRLLLFCVPLLLIPLAAGLDSIRSRPWRWFFLIWIVGFPAFTASYHLFAARWRDPNPYGDRRPSDLNPYCFPLPQPAGWFSRH